MNRLGSWLGLLMLAAFVVWLTTRVHGLETDVRDLTERLNVSPVPSPADGATGRATSTPTLTAETSFQTRVERALKAGALCNAMLGASQDRELASAVERLVAVRLGNTSPATSGNTPSSETPSPDDPVFFGAVKDVVMELTDQVSFRTKLGLHVPPKDIPKNAKFAKVADVLALDQTQSNSMRKDVETMQRELMAVLTEERSDGVDVMAQIAKAESLKEGDPDKTEIFVKLFQLKIPGTESTYFDRVTRLQRAFRERTLDYLSEEQLERLKGINVDWFSLRMD